MTLMVFAIVVIAVAVFFICRRITAKRETMVGEKGIGRGRLPPGSMGWPYIGETFQLYSGNPNSFFAEKQRKYGAVFKTHMLGCPCVMVSSPEAAKFVLVTKAHLFKPTFPASKERMLGPQAIFFQQGEYHSRLRRLVLRAFMPDAIRAKIAGVEEIAVETLSSCDGRFINTFQEMKTVSCLFYEFRSHDRSTMNRILNRELFLIAVRV